MEPEYPDKDDILVQKFKDGDKRSLERLYQKYKKNLFKLIWCYVQNLQDTEDILQQIFEKLIKNIHKYKKRQNCQFKTYLYRVTINHCKDFLKRRKLQNLFTAEALRESGEDDKRLKDIEEACVIDTIRRSVKALPGIYRDVVILIFFENLSYQDVAHILNKPLGTIKSRSHYALQLLRKKLKGVNHE
ncbi:MAG: RNA polymerase sigma factor [Spirochaetes bacterium]|nr:RNA polymerase sigma factor [Spirochaetota bacterium]